jgi:23S rRNA pseudouridine2605 synthase
VSVSTKNKEVRLQKYIADCGITSRRKAEDLIATGRVRVNGKQLTIMGSKVNPNVDVVEVDGQSIDHHSVNPIYIMMNKPRGYVTTLDDPEGRHTVMELCKEVSERIYPVGRLDYLSEGLLLMTNDGEVANMLMHPSFNVTKVYEVKVFGAVTPAILKQLRAGVQMREGMVKPKSVRVIKQLPTKTWLEFRLGEGRNREIRRLCEACSLTVDKLRRVAIGNLSIDNLAPGRYFFMNKKELLRAIGFVGGVFQEREYFSAKRSVNLNKKGVQDTTEASSPLFRMFRKGEYYSTVKGMEEARSRNQNDRREQRK